MLGEVVAVGVNADAARNASLLLKKTWEPVTALLGVHAARASEDVSSLHKRRIILESL